MPIRCNLYPDTQVEGLKIMLKAAKADGSGVPGPPIIGPRMLVFGEGEMA